MRIKGKYNEIKIFTDDVEESAKEQLKQLANTEYMRDSKIRVMPDVHAGAGCTIGTTMTIGDKVCPNIVGVDIGCGVTTVKLNKPLNLELLDHYITNYVPSGYHVHGTPQTVTKFIEEIEAPVDLDRAKRSVGTLGGGNHFIEIGVDIEGDYWLSVHSGSRKLGLEVAKYYQSLAEDPAAGKREDIIKHTPPKERESELSKIEAVPKDLWPVTGEIMKAYLRDMARAQDFAVVNRRNIISNILRFMGTWYSEMIESIHNYIDMDTHIIRKGAIRANTGELLVIPMNMRDGVLLCRGKGNADWNYSAPHGAGRIMSRTQAKKEILLEDFEASMKCIYSTSVNESTLDEAPAAYKDPKHIMSYVHDTVEILDIIVPVYNFKA